MGRTYFTRRPIFARGINQWVVDIDGTHGMIAANNTVHDVGLQDLGLAFWIRADTGAGAGILIIIAKYGGSDLGYYFSLLNGKVYIKFGDDIDAYVITGTTDLRDDEWHSVAAIIDRDNAANCKLYVDAVDDTDTKTGTLASVGSLSNSAVFEAGSFSGLYKFDGELRNGFISYPADIMAAGEIGASGELANYHTYTLDPSRWPNSEDYWLCNEGTGTTITGQNNNLTLSNANAWNLTNFP